MNTNTTHTNCSEGFLGLDASGILSWVHFGDLHITTAQKQNYREFLALIDSANGHLTGAGSVNFAVLPGDNAEDGTEEQFHLVRQAVDCLRIPTHILPGDHDIKSGTLADFQRMLRPGPLPHAFTAAGYHCLFLNSVDTGSQHGFGHGAEQIEWLTHELESAAKQSALCVVFMHTYPSELGSSAQAVSELIRRHRVLLVDTGHTHYNELCNDGTTLYAATRSTGQNEEGQAGFSVSAIDNGVVSWKFKELDQPWPLVMITSPADELLITDPGSANQVVKGRIEIRAKVWGMSGSPAITCRVDDGPVQPMWQIGDSRVWRCHWNSSLVPDGAHQLVVSVDGVAHDSITLRTSQHGVYESPVRQPIDNANPIGAYLGKGILGTQLGPNKNGKKW